MGWLSGHGWIGMDHYRLARQLGKILLVWSAVSIVVGVGLFLVPISLVQGIGLQAILWGVIDAVIAGLGVLRTKEQSAAKMARFLLINVFLDVGYQVVGLVVILFLWPNAFLLGNGIGIIIQGAFLFVLDLYFYRRFRLLPAPPG